MTMRTIIDLEPEPLPSDISEKTQEIVRLLLLKDPSNRPDTKAII